MLILSGVYKDGSIIFLDEPPAGLVGDVLVSFVDTDQPCFTLPFNRGKAIIISSRDLKTFLYQRELKVLQLISKGLSIKEMAEKLGCTEGRISSASNIIFKKFQVHKRSDAIRKGIDLGFLPQTKSIDGFYIDENASILKPYLNPREMEVLQLLSEDFTERQISEHLGLSIGQVRYTWTSLFRKFHAHNKIEAVRRGYEYGYLMPSSDK